MFWKGEKANLGLPVVVEEIWFSGIDFLVGPSFEPMIMVGICFSSGLGVTLNWEMIFWYTDGPL